jgi:hypothetical protein
MTAVGDKDHLSRIVDTITGNPIKKVRDYHVGKTES